MNDLELIGLDYLWRVVLCAPDEIAAKAIELLKETYTNLGPRLQANQVITHFLRLFTYTSLVHWPSTHDCIELP